MERFDERRVRRGNPAAAWTTLILAAGLCGCAASKGDVPGRAESSPDAVPTATGPGSLRLGSPFGSHMVLQRDVEVPIWGTDAPGHVVAITDGAKSAWTARAGDDGKWTAEIGPFAAGGPYTITVAGTGTVVLEDVLAGEVWLASGQSNMEFALDRADGGAEDAAKAANPSIRLLTIPRTGAIEPQDFVSNQGWKVCAPDSAASFSAVAYHFGHELHEKLGVPIGLVHASWGGSNMESWTPTDAMADDPMLSWTVEDRRQWISTSADMETVMEAYRKATAEWNANPRANRHIADPGNIGAAKDWMKPAFDDSGWDTVGAPEQMNLKFGNYDGVYCLRKTVDIPPAWTGRALVLDLGAIDDEDVTYFNGVEVGRMGKETPGVASAPRSYAVPASFVRGGSAVIAVRVFDKALGGGLLGPAGDMKIAPAAGAGRPIQLAGDWRYEIAYKENGVPQTPMKSERSVPGMLYNGMIHPVAPYRVRGTIWYQGESNMGRAEQYRHLSEAMIGSWRGQFGNPDMWFFYVQLAGYGTKHPGWIGVMDAQRRTLEVPRTGMAVAADVGDEKDIHPTDKRTVGHRLALVARARVYGEKIVSAGPTIRTAEPHGDQAVLRFDNVGGGLVSRASGGGKQIGGFEVAGSDQEFKPATAAIEGDSIVVSSPGVSRPATVRYAWANYPACDLYNTEGLPAPPFSVAVGR